jgi:hypothetical protein
MMFFTCETCQHPPLAGRTPREFNAWEIPRRSITPVERIEWMIGKTLPANASASAT